MNAENLRQVAGGLLFPESPRWRDGAVWFTSGPRVISVVPGEPAVVRAEVPSGLALGVAFLADGRAVTDGVFDRVVYAIGPDGKAEPYVDLSAHTSTPINELSVTNDGGLLVAPMGFNMLLGEAPAPTQLLRVHPDMSVEPTGPELVFPNGMTLLDEGRRLVISDALRERVVSIEIRADGTLADDAEVVADLSGWHGHADGICALPDGSVWYADPLAGEVVKVANGANVHRFQIDGYPHPTSCVVDPETGTVYITATTQMPAPGKDFEPVGALLAYNPA